jgi:hypothetical protein
MKTIPSGRFLKGMIAAILTAVFALACVSAKAAHELIYAVDVNNNLVSFWSDDPGNFVSAYSINGLQLNEEIRGLDAWEGVLYGLGSSSRLYKIDPTTGLATQIGTGQFSPLLNGQTFGFESGGATGLRAVSALAQSLLIDQNTGTATAGPTVNYVLGDSNYGAIPRVDGLAYDMYTGQWLAADTSKNILASFNPTTGGLSTIALMGFDVARYNGMDISPDTGIMYLVSAATSSDPQGNLYVVDKLTGMSTLVGQVGYFGNEVLYRALTVAPEPSSIALLGLGALGLILARRRK